MGATMRGPPLALNRQLCKTESRFRNMWSRMDWDDLRVFRAVAGAPTLTAAARHLGASVATVARRIDALEATLGFRLLDRSRAGVRLTTRGRAVFARAALAGDAVDDVARLAASLLTSAWPDPIRISATEPIVSDILAPALPKLLAAAPDIRVDLSSSTDVVSLAGREADVAVRLARPVGDSLVVRRLPPFDLGLFAAKSYLAGRRPADLDLRRERLLGFDASYGRIAEVAWMEKSGLADAVVVRSSSTRALINATRAGAGIGLLPQFLVRSDPTLLEIPGPTPMPSRPAWLVTHRDLRHARPLQIVREWISGAVRAAQGA
jgi:DNA-binding transcriptional LysR family regulator